MIVLPEHKDGTDISEHKIQIQLPVLLKRQWVQGKTRQTYRDRDIETGREKKGVKKTKRHKYEKVMGDVL